MNRTSQKGFTLIELLIVVAIIAILAAIAVPNFLEAQVRAKVSRTKSDMRALNTAIEAYYVDQNRYPTDRDVAGKRPQGAPAGTEVLANELSTPISYITSMEIANDPFKVERKETTAARRLYNYRNIQALAKGNPSGFNAQMEQQGGWRLISAGPDRFTFWDGGTPKQDYQNYAIINYDPTNGTVSIGDITRSQKFSDGIKQQ